MAAQQALFDLNIQPVRKKAIKVNKTVDVRERRRLSRQAVDVLVRIQNQNPPPTNFDLSKIALKYSSRISELRQAGYNVVCFNRDFNTGVAYYKIEEKAA